MLICMPFTASAQSISPQIELTMWQHILVFVESKIAFLEQEIATTSNISTSTTTGSINANSSVTGDISGGAPVEELAIVAPLPTCVINWSPVTASIEGLASINYHVTNTVSATIVNDQNGYIVNAPITGGFHNYGVSDTVGANNLFTLTATNSDGATTTCETSVQSVL